MAEARYTLHYQIEQTQYSVVVGDHIPQLSTFKYDFELEMCFQPDFELQMSAEIWLSSSTSPSDLKPVLIDVAEVVDQLNDFQSIY
jgi:hypothetical protein